MKNKYHERLRLLAQHLMEGKLRTKAETIIDDTSVVETQEYIEELVPYYVYPMKELPYMFADWKMDRDCSPYWVGDKNKTPVTSAMLYFDFCFDVFKHIFSPNEQNIEWFGGKVLSKTASPQEIAHNMLELLKRVENI